MTGPAEGKVPIDIKLIFSGVEIPCEAYIHLKGYSRARITHLDLEGFSAEGPNKIIGCRAVGVEGGLTIVLFRPISINGRRGRKIMLRGISVLDVGERAKCVLGMKEGGVFIGFESKVLSRLEEMGRRLWKSG